MIYSSVMAVAATLNAKSSAGTPSFGLLLGSLALVVFGVLLAFDLGGVASRSSGIIRVSRHGGVSL